MTKQYLELILFRIYADLRAERERTYLGFLWWIFEPVMFMGVFVIVFGVGLRHGGPDFVPFLLVGLVDWQWFKSCISHGGGSIMSNSRLIKQVYLPKIIFPIITILTDTVKFAFILVLLMGFLWLNGYHFGAALLALPVLLLMQLLLICGLTLLVSALVPLFPDFRFIVESALLAGFFMSGVFFSAAQLPAELRPYFYLNPMASLIDSLRAVLLHNQWPDWGALGTIGVLSVVLIALGYWVLARLDYLYPKISG